jgi:hypothetical protein
MKEQVCGASLNDGGSPYDEVGDRHLVGGVVEAQALPLGQLRHVVQLQLVPLVSGHVSAKQLLIWPFINMRFIPKLLAFAKRSRWQSLDIPVP